jgi:hypothetical protein
MRRRRSQKPLIPFIPKYKKIVDRAGEIYALLATTKSDEFIARLKAELVIISGNLKFTDVITEKQIYVYNDAWNKQTIPNMDVYVRKVDDMYLATVDGKTCEIFNFEDEYPFADNEIGCFSIAPDAKNSDVYFRDTFFRIYNKGVTANEAVISFLNSLDPDKVVLQCA